MQGLGARGRREGERGKQQGSSKALHFVSIEGMVLLL